MHTRIEMPDYIEYAIDTLGAGGYGAYAVGGCVRDSLLGAAPKDWDIATDAKPFEISHVFYGHRQLTHGAKYGTVAVFVGDAPAPVEITTYRTDGEYSDNRRPDTVIFAPDLREDLRRRDFTINALAYRHDCGVIDYFGGRADLDGKVIRCVGDARERFGEDALRIMRALRFASTLSFNIEERTASAMRGLEHSLKNIAAERVCAELTGILAGDGAGAEAVLMEFFDIFCLLIPELDGRTRKIMARAVGASAPCVALRASLLLWGVAPADARGALMRLRFSGDVIGDVVELLAHRDADVASGDAAIRRLLHKIGPKRLRLLLGARRALARACKKATQAAEAIEAAENRMAAIIARGDCYSLKDLNIKGGDLIALGFKPGRALGAALDTLLDGVMSGDCQNDRAALCSAAQMILRTALQR